MFRDSNKNTNKTQYDLQSSLNAEPSCIAANCYTTVLSMLQIKILLCIQPEYTEPPGVHCEDKSNMKTAAVICRSVTDPFSYELDDITQNQYDNCYMYLSKDC